MSYTKQTWANGDVITAEKLNHMEEGISANGVLVVGQQISGNTMTLDKTWQEIRGALLTGGAIIAAEAGGFALVGYSRSTDKYGVMDITGNVYTATTEDGYPVFEMS